MKKLLTILLVIAMLFSATACGGKKEDNNTTTTTTAPTLTYLYNNGSGHQAIAEYFQGALATAGVNIQLENQEWATFLNTRKNGDFTIARNGWLGDFNDPISFLDMWTTESGNNDCQFGKGAHKDAAIYSVDCTDLGIDLKVENGTWAETYDAIIAIVKTSADQDLRFALMHKAEDLLMSTGAITPLYYYTDVYMISDKISGFYSSPLGYKFFNKTTLADGSTTLPVCIASEPDNIDPALNSSVDGATLVSHCFSALAKWDSVNGVPTVVAELAKELSEPVYNEDGTVTYTYELVSGAKWSDGVEVKASDFEWAWKRAASDELGADYGYMFDCIKGYGTPEGLDVTADDAAGTITVTLNNYTAYWNELLAFPTYMPLRRDIVENNEAWATDPSTYVTNGMYTMTGWDHNSKITLTKNPDYVNADEVTMEVIEFYLSDDDNAMLSNFKTGDWLFIDSVPNAEIDTLKAEYANEFVIAGQLGTYYVCWNVNADLLGAAGKDMDVAAYQNEQAAVRNAMSLVLDRNYIVREIGKAGQEPASSFVALGLIEPDGSEFCKNAGHNDAFVGYYDVAEEAYEANYNAAMEVISKYYGK
ncbi:MAG: ABC transporter substrate-binding protein [Erysipelotrichaceae bacterium]|nr:ABC transporter substrate-binding protein [Erysipelotrichaceae bacterium]